MDFNNMIGFNRDTRDAFYTKPAIASDCVHLLKQHINLDSFKTIIEPSAGNGSFSNLFKDDDRLQSYDIYPNHNSITKADFLSVDLFLEGSTLVIGNPPFGRQSMLLKQFIKRCCNQIKAECIAFILPLSFSNQYNQRVFPLSYHLTFEYPLPKESFTVNGISHHVPTVFQIWVKKETNRSIKPFTPAVGFHYVKSGDECDFAICRQGSKKKRKLKLDTEGLIDSTHFFIKFDVDICMKEFEEHFNNHVSFVECYNTLLNSITKDEMNRKLNPIIKELKF